MRLVSVLSFAAAFSLLLVPGRGFSAEKAPAEKTPPAEKSPPAKPNPDDARAGDKCDHGVKKTICTRCNPKLKPVFKAKNDWCAEHDRPESQCAICHPDLEKKGVKK
jgi:hypothetical protein